MASEKASTHSRKETTLDCSRGGQDEEKWGTKTLGQILEAAFEVDAQNGPPTTLDAVP